MNRFAPPARDQAMPPHHGDLLDHIVVFLQKREGIDKVRRRRAVGRGLAPPARERTAAGEGSTLSALHSECPILMRLNQNASSAYHYLPRSTPSLLTQTLKLIRYTSKLLVACTPEAHPTRARLAAFESSVGTSRKALRLGKFLQNVNALRKSSLGGPYFALELVANSGEGAYFFLEQLVWCVTRRFRAPLLRASLCFSTLQCR